jgi:glutathione S-transferase
MPRPVLRVLSLRYSSWSIRPWLALSHAGIPFVTETVEIPPFTADPKVAAEPDDRASRRARGSVSGLFPVLWIDDTPVHESLAICEWVADTCPDARLWPADPLARAQARAVCCEMATGFSNMRRDLSCHVFARVPAFPLRPETRADVDRVFEIWNDLLDRHGGPFLTGTFGIADCMFFPVITRFRTYSVALPPTLEAYARRVEASASVQAWREVARRAPRFPRYDEDIRSLGGDPDAEL